MVEWDAAHQMVKVNPIAAWTFDDLLDYAGTHQVPVNLLLTDGLPVDRLRALHAPGRTRRGPRAGRWAGLAKTECGLHP